ncbi:hypothetical protein AB4455_07370 [Vibrio sp. 10N.261.46.E12]|uniref:hypothetical protein n=1 Tax=unclassified Vibrio TaxID=2614977 RepID=UPI000975FD4D|nr:MULTISPECIES: hypothetical protein [unclassified Vibrio]OMO36457.1 hypothetical protein BH584_04015 [Vibrio sp. 10N.261.45.E1]PMJ22123.1 hypothetical protein BCU27_17055 [Vibrio sp. 10N.286.45.B6]PML97433.1 hypothetical protein BCT66_21145 [Vibrio sp. 10N.261.49.E11]PMM76565.1 hypothetical protein BCT48_02000 [Vibrio sp. 10N.261.46.F12]PMM82476.1 hypothetical protein BCT46_14085 [Vibrio sp. 10N.261.46.E8]
MSPRLTKQGKQRQVWLEQASYLVTPLNDNHDTRDFKFFAISGIDSNELRLAVWHGSDSHYWALSSLQGNEWTLCGSLKEPLFALAGTKTSWRNDVCQVLTWGFSTPIEWLQDVLTNYREKQQAT